MITHIEEPPKLDDSVLIDGQSLSLFCVAVGCPPATITWHVSTAGQDGPYVPVLENSWSKQNGSRTSSVLNISSVTRLNTNYYRCLAYNGIGSAANETVYVSVYCK